MEAADQTDAVPLPGASSPVARVVWRGKGAEPGFRSIPEETPIALVYDGSTEAVMMATPADLEDFALGFSLTEGLIDSPSDVRQLDIEVSEAGIEARMWLTADRSRDVSLRRRTRTGPTGCGLCGIDSLKEANRLRVLRPSDFEVRLVPEQIRAAVASLEDHQPLGQKTRAVHAAGYWTPKDGLVLVREDVGRHNALDKLVGGLMRAGIDASAGVVVLTSRVSVEMVQKTAAMGTPVLVAISAPTGLAVRTANQAGITLAGIARTDGFEVFSHPHRITF